MKKFLAMLLTLVMIWSLSIQVFAATDGEEDTAIITGLTITVDGVTYTEGQTAVITPDTKSIIIAVSGNNLRNATADNSVHITPGQPGYSDDLTSNYWTVSEDGKTATEDVSDLRVYYKTLTAFEFGFTNDGWETTESSGVSVIYEDGLTEEERAVITGLSLTVDDITYTKGQIAVITPETKSVIITVTGTNLKNATISNIAEFCYGYFDYIVSSRWTVSEDGTTATADMSSLISEVYTNTTAHELVFSNEGTDGGTESGVSVIYLPAADNTAPELVGIEDGGVYYGDKIFKAIDDNFLKIEVDGVDVTDTTQGDDEYKIVADNAEHIITVTDKAGNVTVCKIAVYKQYTVTFMDENGVYETIIVKHGETLTMPEVPEKDGYTVTWEKEIDTVTSDVTVKAVYTKNPVDDIKSPQTGDDSNRWLRFALLFVGGVGIFGITICNQKRRSIN